MNLSNFYKKISNEHEQYKKVQKKFELRTFSNVRTITVLKKSEETLKTKPLKPSTETLTESIIPILDLDLKITTMEPSV